MACVVTKLQSILKDNLGNLGLHLGTLTCNSTHYLPQYCDIILQILKLIKKSELLFHYQILINNLYGCSSKLECAEYVSTQNHMQIICVYEFVDKFMVDKKISTLFA